MPYYDDDGNEIEAAAIPMPGMCMLCDKRGDEDEEILCNLTRLDQMNKETFTCHAFSSLYGPLLDDIIE